MKKNEIKVFTYGYSVILNKDNSLTFRTKRFGLLNEEDLLKIISEATTDKNDSKRRYKDYKESIDILRPSIAKAIETNSPNKIWSAGIWYVIEEYCSFERNRDMSKVFEERRNSPEPRY